MRRQAQSVTLAGATAARPLGARSGVRPGTSTSTVTATATAWSCGPFAGVIDAEAAAEAGPYEFAFDATATGTITAADGTNPRTDIIYVQVSDPSEGDGSTVPSVVRGYLAGTAAATPVAPAAPARSFVVAQINVPKAGGGNPTVTWVAPYAVAAGGVIPVNTLANLKTITTAHAGQKARVFGDGLNNGDYVYDGTVWTGKAFMSRSLSAQQAIPVSTWTTVGFTSDQGAGGGGITYSGGVFTVATAGRYLLTSQLAFLASPQGGQRVATIEVNGATIVQSQQWRPDATYSTTLVLAKMLSLNAGDKISIKVYQSQDNAQGLMVSSFIDIDRVD